MSVLALAMLTRASPLTAQVGADTGRAGGSQSLARLQFDLTELRSQRDALRSALAPLDTAMRIVEATRRGIAQLVYPRALDDSLRALRATVARREDSRAQADREAVRNAVERVTMAFEGAFDNALAVAGQGASREARSLVRTFPASEVSEIAARYYGESPPFMFSDTAPLLTRAALDSIAVAAEPSSFDRHKARVDQFLAARASELATQATPLRQELSRVGARIQSTLDTIGQREEGRVSLDRWLIGISLPVFGLAMIALMALPKFYGSETLQLSIFSSGILLELTTVFLLTVTVLILGLGGRLQQEVTGTLLGGISGYVLGRSARRRDAEESKSS